MNKQELIEGYERISNFCETVSVNKLIQKLKQLDEPQPVKVPQFVADWIEYCKFTHVDLQHALIVGDVYFYNYANQTDFSKLKEFLETENNQETFARAWLDGYEVDEEKRYTVRIKGVEEDSAYLKHQLQNNHWYYGSLTECSLFSPYHTQKQLEEANFGWVLDCEGIEIEEVK